MIPRNLTKKSKLKLCVIFNRPSQTYISNKWIKQEKDILMPKMCDLIGASNIPLYMLT